MGPVSLILSFIDWKALLKKLAGDAAQKGVQGLWSRLQPEEGEKAARQAVRLFVEEWSKELEGTTPFSSAVPGYQDQLKRLLESAAPEIAAWADPEKSADPEKKEVDLHPLERLWRELKLDALPQDFNWKLVAQNYGRALQRWMRSDPEMRERLSLAARERTAEAAERMAGPEAGFHLSGYREFLKQKCSALQLAVMHASTYQYDRRVTLWSIFIPQTARESFAVSELPSEVERRLREQGHLTQERDERTLEELRDNRAAGALRPVLEVLEREPRVVVLGDPGSGKTSLLKYLALRWANHEGENEDGGPLPLWVDLREYITDRRGLPEYFESGCAAYRLDARELDRRLQAGQAALYLDGLDEIFDASTRGSVTGEIIALAARYPQAPMVVTSRVFGYEPERLQKAGFLHATLEDFDEEQIAEFLRRWHQVAEEDSRERERLGERIMRAIADSASIRELAGNPLLLTMMAILNRNQELPRGRVDLYREASRVLLHEWDFKRALPVDQFDWHDKEALLRDLAGEMQQAEGGLAGNLIERSLLLQRFRSFLQGLGIQDSYQKASLLVQQLTERNFILSFAGADHFRFIHRTFLEYYCAAWFVERFEKKQTLTLQELKEEIFGRHWKDEKWHEVLRLIASMVEEKKAEELILFLMGLEGRGQMFANLMLAAQCLSDVRNRQALRETDQTLWQRFIEEAIRYRSLGDDSQRWLETVSIRQAVVRQIAVTWRGEQARPWLESAITGDLDLIVRGAAVQELARGWKDHPGTLPLLQDRARSDQHAPVRLVAVWELVRGWKDHPGTLPLLQDRARSDENENVRVTAVEQLVRGWKDHPGTLPLLQDRARFDEDEDESHGSLSLLPASPAGVPLQERASGGGYAALKARYQLLVDQKYLSGLTPAESEELLRLESALDEMDQPYYNDALRRLSALEQKGDSRS